MKPILRRCLIVFFALIAALTLVSWKLDALRTPVVVCTLPGPGFIDGQSFDYVLPLSCLHNGYGKTYVYTVEETASWFYPLAARRVEVMVQSQNNTTAAVLGVYRGMAIVQYSSRNLLGESMPVSLWEEG